MPDWMIKINRKTAGVDGASSSRIEFTPNPREALAGDVINWRNNDSEPHWPAPLQGGQLIEKGYMDNAIPPGETSDTAFSPDFPPDFSPDDVRQYIEIEYGCMHHPDEKGVIRLLRHPPALATS